MIVNRFVLLTGLLTGASSIFAASVDSAAYRWSFRQGAGVSGRLLFKAAASILTFDSCPAGLAPGNFIYLSGGTGTPESAPIKSASCPVGARGSITIATSKRHWGKWSAATSTAGVQEAVNALSSTGGTILLSPGIFEVHSHIVLASNIVLRGAGIDKTTIAVPREEFTNSPPWQFGINPGGTVILGPPGHSGITVTGLTVQFGKQSTPPNGSYGILLVNVNHSLIDAVAVRDGPILRKGNTFLPIGVLGLAADNTVQNNFIYNQPCSISSEGSGGFIAAGKANRFVRNYVSNGCNSAYVTLGADNVFEENVFELAGSTMVPGAQAFAADNSSGARFLNNRCLGNGTAPACFSAVTDSKTPETSDSTFIGNEARNCGQGFQFQSTVAHSRQIRVEKGSVVNCTTPLTLMGIIDDVSIQGVEGVQDLRTDRIVSIPVNSEFLHDVPTVGADVIWMMDAAGDYTVGGFKEGASRRKVQIVNAAGHSMTFSGNDLKSRRENRICTSPANEMASPPESRINLAYSAERKCWLVSGAIEPASDR
jgi:hypothetical protein